MADDISLEQVTTLEEAYNVFSLGVGSEYREVKVRYHKLARKHHPDRTGGTDSSIFQHINFAFQVITQQNHKEKRKRARDEEEAAKAEKERIDAYWRALREEFPESEKEQRDANWRAFRDEVMNDDFWFTNMKAERKERRKVMRDSKKQKAQETEGFRRLRKMKF
jgi:DnaJ-class molecular chaperone